jgi:hypothetical protein
MSDEAAIIHAAADACRMARVYGCTITLRIGPRRFSGIGPVELEITPDSSIAIVDLPADTIPPPAAEYAEPPKGLP